MKGPVYRESGDPCSNVLSKTVVGLLSISAGNLGKEMRLSSKSQCLRAGRAPEASVSTR